MAIPKLVKNGQNSASHSRVGFPFKKNKETKEIQTALQATKKNKNHFWTNFGTHMRAYDLYQKANT